MANIINKRIDVRLTEEEHNFLKWLAKRDNVSLNEELKALFNLQLREEMDLYLDEMLQEESQQ
jgi:hypothetical protein